MTKHVGVLFAGAVSAVMLSGCIVFTGAITGEQQDVVGKLRLTFALCASGRDDGVEPGGPNEDHPGCPSQGNSPTVLAYGSAGVQYQVLFAIRVPAGAGVPVTISAMPGPTPPAAGTIAARRNTSYEAELNATKPPPAGSQWVGYLSDTYPFDDGADDVPAQSAQVIVDLELPKSADGSPFVGPLALRPVVGARVVDPAGELSADRPVECGTDPTIMDLEAYTICIDSPFPGDLPGQLDRDLLFPTRDFGVVAGNATASPGQTVAMPFRVRGAGALPAGLTAGLTASTTLPGVQVAVSQPAAPLADGSDTRVTVPLTIPRNAGPGVHDVAVTARLDNGEARTGTARLTVRDRQVPVLTGAKAKPKRFRAATRRRPRRGTNVSFRLSEVGQVRIVVERCAKRARRKGSRRRTGRCLRFKAMKGALTRPAGAGSNSLRFNGRMRGKALKPGPYRLALTPTDTAGNRGATVRARLVVARP
jgi:hypothetical protein